ncbi:hypothetical protein GZH47_13280 [Paenibacillus rhizovicinus]|uniref:Alpha/beta hydrolase n=1 Tax=Paenibacillus rhizovicinus TaxID=2704463 RepID=A0A6C0P0H0_9BACL|nr:hypothetical protein [Paenibacillus rhizovicinus]QHW31716.1 hypothetical protein GZH47_13280 [Paenibacillus rhizovicinus]
MISLYYPALPAAGSHAASERYAGLFHPGEEAAGRFFEAMGAKPAALAAIPVEVHHDAALATVESAYPVIVYAPAFGIERDMYWYNVRRLVASGFMVVTVGAAHESAFTVFPDGEEVGQQKSLSDLVFEDHEAWEELLCVRTADLAFVLDRLQELNESDALLRHGMDLAAVSLIGHSLGGAAVYRVLQQQVTSSRPLIKAGVLLDPSLHLLGSDASPIHSPVLLLRQQSSNLDMLLQQGWREVLAQAFIQGQLQLADVLAAERSFIRIHGAGHLTFCDVPALLGDNETDGRHQVINETIIRFLNEYARGRTGEYRDHIGSISGASRISAEGDLLH